LLARERDNLSICHRTVQQCCTSDACDLLISPCYAVAMGQIFASGFNIVQSNIKYQIKSTTCLIKLCQTEKQYTIGLIYHCTKKQVLYSMWTTKLLSVKRLVLAAE